jgi:hypothetical protein
MTMTRTLWTDETTGRTLDRGELTELHRRARALFEANRHIFEDEMEALSALGAVPLLAQLAADVDHCLSLDRAISYGAAA